MIFFLIAAPLCVLVPSAWLVRLRLQARGRPALPVGDTPSDLLRVAYLRGGAGRVVDTVITAMHADGRITVQQGRVTVVEPVARTAVERALLRHCASWTGNSLRALRREVRRDPALTTVDGSLVEQGLLLPPAARRLWPRVAGVQMAGLVTGAAFALVLLADARRAAGLATLAVAAAGIVVQVVCRPRKAKIPRTDQGEKLAWDLETFRPWAERDPAAHPAGAAGVLAVRGPAALTDTALRKEFEKASRTRRPTRTATRHRSGSSYSSGSSTSSAVAVVGASCDVGCAAADTGGPGDANSGCSSSSSSSCSSCSSSSSCSSGSSCSSSSCS
ncbi:TIGR04222 domain-containing membrane protein [Streptomyces sp. SCA3-4]|uniref:TIGR04222 domain-containing membrane protein n=1 Tax=Streptomyces sichuanensis TaxID=2871810 RepID=UPI001CE2EF21|nr:TIGR04222 domain-containing membrane protein [Streptomyces sichuanensis]MCA6094548.1 TIGR04222 domain-containing membrane protein [Streptomyces sichuanensis]